LPVLCPVDEQGRFTADAGSFQGKAIRPGEADGAVLTALNESGNLLKREAYKHNYPHCWRCKGPLIFRTTVQWFMDIDHPVPAEQMLPPGFRCPQCQSAGPFSKEQDVLEVWFDSGSTWSAVLEQRPELRYPADLYLEGSDQHRGWFNSSLMVSVGARGRAPY